MKIKIIMPFIIFLILIIGFTYVLFTNFFVMKNDISKKKDISSCQKIFNLTLDTAFSVDQTLCEQCGGRWGIGPHRNGCNPKTLDSGKICSDNSQCEGLCLTEYDNESVTTGVCSQLKFVYGCNREIINGIPQPVLCRDN